MTLSAKPCACFVGQLLESMAREDAPTGDFDAKYSIDDAGYEPSPDSIRGDVAEKRAGDNPAEKGAPGDPFGDESNNEVKYRYALSRMGGGFCSQ